MSPSEAYKSSSIASACRRWSSAIDIKRSKPMADMPLPYGGCSRAVAYAVNRNSGFTDLHMIYAGRAQDKATRLVFVQNS
ncbi:hypothetical protein Arad_1019 [Rhizobium rhizogenes K84]|uniref:Uncharacterized protein n=1 Tax=Rhizobium rhizogenes (strain K84 / ATCC BAA-868) TaxID=311403 RepID=B9J9V2_RHIR8|nr:hypothetical protein Arad_1019 [Rhizobium rhizogenes K84]